MTSALDFLEVETIEFKQQIGYPYHCGKKHFVPLNCALLAS